MAFQPTDEGRPLLDAFRWNEEEFEEIEQATTSSGASPEIPTGSNIGKNFSGIESEGMQDSEITHEYYSFKIEGSSVDTEVAPPNHSESVRTMRERLLEDGLDEYDRSIVRFGKKIGKGGQGAVYEATVHWPFCNEPMTMAVKKFNPNLGISQCRYPREIWSLVLPRILRPRGFFFDEDSSLCLIMPMLSGDLRGAIDAEMRNVMSCKSGAGGASPFKDLVAFAIILDLAMGMKSLHDIGVCHRDLKAENVLVVRTPVDMPSEDGIKNIYSSFIADFETSKDVQGTAFWRAPEVLLSLRTGTQLTNNQWPAADVYSFGMTCYEVLTGEIPFHGHRACDYDIVLDGGRPELPDYVPELLGNIIRRCWHPDPGCRPDFGDILEALKEADKYGLTKVFADTAGSLQTMLESLNHEARDPDSDLLRLHELVEKHSNHVAHKFYLTYASWGAKFVACATEFVSEFGWNSYITHPRLPFTKFIKREKLAILLTHHFRELGYDLDANCDAHNNVSNQYWPGFFDEKIEMIFLARNLYTTLKRMENNVGWEGRWEGSHHDLTLKEKLKSLRGFTMDIIDVRDGASALKVIEDILEMLAMDYSLGTNIDEITKFYHLMKFRIRGRRFLKNYGMLLQLSIGCIVLSLISRFEFWNHVLFRMFGIKLFDFYDVFLGLFCTPLEFQVIIRLVASFPKYSRQFAILHCVFSITSLCLLVKSYGFLGYLIWSLVGYCFWNCVEFVCILLFASCEYLYMKLVPATSSAFARNLRNLATLSAFARNLRNFQSSAFARS